MLILWAIMLEDLEQVPKRRASRVMNGNSEKLTFHPPSILAMNYYTPPSTLAHGSVLGSKCDAKKICLQL